MTDREEMIGNRVINKAPVAAGTVESDFIQREQGYMRRDREMQHEISVLKQSVENLRVLTRGNREMERRELSSLRREVEMQREMISLRREIENLRIPNDNTASTTSRHQFSVKHVSELLSEYHGTEAEFPGWKAQIMWIKDKYELDDRNVKILISSKLKGKAFRWLHSK